MNPNSSEEFKTFENDSFDTPLGNGVPIMAEEDGLPARLVVDHQQDGESSSSARTQMYPLASSTGCPGSATSGMFRER